MAVIGRGSSEMRRRFSCSEISELEERLDADIQHYSYILERLGRDSYDETMKKVCCHTNLPAREKFSKLIGILLEIQQHSEMHVRDLKEVQGDEAQKREPPGRSRDSGVVSVNSEALAELPYPVEETRGPEKCEGPVPPSYCSKVSDCSTLKEEHKEKRTDEEEDNAINDLQQQNQTSPKLYEISSEAPSAESAQVLSDHPTNSADIPGDLSASPPNPGSTESPPDGGSPECHSEALPEESSEHSEENPPNAARFYLPDDPETDKDEASEC